MLDVLELFVTTRRPMSHSEIAGELNIPKSSLTQLLRNLESRGYLTFTPGANTYSPGPAIAKLASSLRVSFDIASIAQPIIDLVAKRVQETTSVSVLRGNEVERVATANAIQRPLRYWMTVGERMPLHATSAGKAIMAFLPAKDRNEIISSLPLSKTTSKTIGSIAALKSELKRTAEEKVAYSNEEFELGVFGISVPILDAKQRPVASLGVVFPSVRDTAAHRDAILKALRDGGRRLEDEVNHLA
ncbi:IclR family transcriptional regulator [Pseudorhodoplanes sp.]|uniref:IclR family transcriptional regulator n=1 Tax=Pseudorhodoplanes sp. TaxID=1934341 RepID=UPI002BE22677|nr:IclR family transcriptional regulator [Pseudorhodoplanes sp.]HWV55493.1 IclR family transcriptional regulator [Pseudorhodoplanes sp.]